jgi:hypothetical protein
MRHETELNGVEMPVVHVSRKVAIVADRVLRVPPLPNAAFAAAGYKNPSGCGTGEAAAFHGLRVDPHAVETVHRSSPTIAQYRIVYSLCMILSNVVAESTLTRLRKGLKGVICSLFLNL